MKLRILCGVVTVAVVVVIVAAITFGTDHPATSGLAAPSTAQSQMQKDISGLQGARVSLNKASVTKGVTSTVHTALATIDGQLRAQIASDQSWLTNNPGPTPTTVPKTTTTVAKTTTSTTQLTTPPPPPPPPPTAQPTSSQPITAGDSKADCVYIGNSVDQTAITKLTGKTYSCIEFFTDADPQWSDIEDPWPTDVPADVAWAKAPGHQLVIAQNPVPDSVAMTSGWESTCASGAYDSHEVKFAQKLIAAGMGNAVIRLGHEMNGDWYYDSLPGTTAGDAAWAQCFARVVTDMRSVAGAHFLFDWNVNANVRAIPLASYYPGDQYVDIIGIDLYDQFGNTSTPPAVSSSQRFPALAAQPDSLNDVEAFAVAHGKPLSFPEWSTILRQGDDSLYIAAMASYIATHEVAYNSYFNDGAEGTAPLGASGNQQSTATYIALFG